MSGIYIHIPFCKKACIYCDFHFSTQLKNIEDFIEALLREMELKKDTSLNIQTIYFGGGTPSVLNNQQLSRIFESLHRNFNISNLLEVTLEANPDDISNEFFNALKNTPINRLSIGVQSFFDDHLQWMNRSHSAKQAIQCVYQAQDKGFLNISLDLIYGFPLLSLDQWEENIHLAVQKLQVPHISAYSLSIEEKTALHYMVKKKQLHVPDELSVQHYRYLIKTLQQLEYVHYETSNFCKNNFMAVHNSSYWLNAPYIGMGPSAHSYNLQSRSFNVSNNAQYIKSLLEDNTLPQTIEQLKEYESFNDFLITRLRTKRGVLFHECKTMFSQPYYSYIMQCIQQYSGTIQLVTDEYHLHVHEEDWIYLDYLLREWILTDDL